MTTPEEIAQIAAEEEREAILAWLRSLGDKPALSAFGFKPHYLQWVYASGFADAIERLEHRKDLSND